MGVLMGSPTKGVGFDRRERASWVWVVQEGCPSGTFDECSKVQIEVDVVDAYPEPTKDASCRLT